MKNYNKFYKKDINEQEIETNTQLIYENEPESRDFAEEKNDGPFYAKVANCNKVYLREQADKDSQWIKILEKDDDILIEEWNDYWYKATTNSGCDGFIMKDFVQIEN